MAEGLAPQNPGPGGAPTEVPHASREEMDANFGPYVVSKMAYAFGGLGGLKDETGEVKTVSQGDEFMDNTIKANKEDMKYLDFKDVKIFDCRPGIGKFHIDREGFQVVQGFKTKLPETLEVLLEPKEDRIRAIYWPEICEVAKQHIVSEGRHPKYVFALGTQKFTEDKSRGVFGSYSRSAHADFSEVVFDGAYKMFTKRGVSEEEAKQLDIMFVNTWKPFGQVVKDNDFTILDWTSLDVQRDCHHIKRGTRTKPGGIYGSMITSSPNHRWVWLPDQTPEEVWLFKQADSRSLDKEPYHLAQYAFHNSFRRPEDPGTDRSRRSISVRVVLGFEPKPKPKPKQASL